MYFNMKPVSEAALKQSATMSEVIEFCRLIHTHQLTVCLLTEMQKPLTFQSVLKSDISFSGMLHVTLVTMVTPP